MISEGGDNWVAFSGKMFYMPAANWGEPQLVRLAWMVEALNDICAPAEPEDEAGTQVEHVGGCTTVETYNDLQVVQIYYDDFSLTGLNVREDHGTTWELVYKDPLAITEVPKTDRINRLAPLNDLVFGLDHTFLAGRVDPKTGERDFPVTEIRRRFDHSINSTVPISPTRFNISDNILLVNPYQYADIDLAYTDITITQTKSILDVYTPFWSVTEPITPTILFAHEEYYRPLNLDSMGAYSNITVTPDGIQYSISLPSSVPADSPMAPVEVFTATALSWAPYIFQGGEWKGAPLDDYLELLSSIYPPNQIDPDPAVAKGALMFLETYYANIYQGYFNIVEQGEQVVETLIEETDEVVAEYLEHWEMVYEPFKIAMEIFFDLQLPYYIYDAIGQIKTFFSNIYSVVNGKIMGLGEFKSFWFYEGISFLEKGSMLAMGIAALAWIITHIPPIYEKLDESVWGKIIIVAISASFTVLITIKTVQAAMKIFAEFGELAASKASELGVIGLIVVTFLFIVAAIAIFGYVMAHNDDINGVQVGLMVATLFAQIVVILLFAFISAIPYIGPIIMAIYNLVNTILSEFLGVSFTEMLIANITEIFYHIDPMVSLTPSVGETVMGFLTEHGVSANNGVNISFPMDVLAMQEDPQTDMEERISNDKDYDLLGTRVSLDVDGNESAITSDSQWKDTYLSHYSHLYDWPRYATHGYLTGNLDTIQFTQAGINQSFTYDSSFYFKIHFWRCILFVFCNDETTHSSIEGEDPPVVFDVFPATIDEFIAWNWEPTLPEHHDLDNDGLLAPSHHGNDPDDTKWDADGDLLSDKWEIDMAAKPATEGGFAYNALKADTDGDGLKDGEEARRGTNPARLDSDGDGRSDFSEVDGYNFVYASPKQVRVFSNPLVYDSDGDGMDDKVEHYLYTKDPVQFPYNPSAWNTVPLALKVQAGVSGFISPGVTFPLTITLQNSADTNIKGDVTTTLPTGITAVNPTTQTYEALANDTAALTNSIQVASNISSSSSLNISSTACGTLEMPLVYLPFDEPVGSVTFYNQATQGRYDMLCQGSMYCPSAGVAGQKGSAVKFQSAIQASILTLSTPDLVFSNKHPFSISVWVYPSSTTRTDKFYLVSQASSSNFSSGYNLYFTTDAQHRYITHFTTAAKEYVFNQPILPSVWTNLVATFDGTNQRLFINGVEASGTLASNVVMSPSTAQVWIGGVRSATYAYILNYLGVMDELFIYDRILADGEIKSSLPIIRHS